MWLLKAMFMAILNLCGLLVIGIMLFLSGLFLMLLIQWCTAHWKMATS